jgi:hypothetical protein
VHLIAFSSIAKARLANRPDDCRALRVCAPWLLGLADNLVPVPGPSALVRTLGLSVFQKPSPGGLVSFLLPVETVTVGLHIFIILRIVAGQYRSSLSVNQ